MALKKVKGHDGLFKDEQTGLLVNRDKEGIRNQYRMAKNQALSNIESRDDIKELYKDVEELKELKDEMSEIKALLRVLVEKQVS